jgi:dTDP-glucose pyrophosphorylase
MISYLNHLITQDKSIKEALNQLNGLGVDAILFVVNENNQLIGSLTDGDVRRGFLRDLTFEDKVLGFTQPNPKFIIKEKYTLETLIDYRKKNFKIIPVLDSYGKIVNIINFRLQKSYLPVDAVVMAGGRGERLKPLTDQTPKPLLRVGDKPIIEYNLDRLVSFGVSDFWISLRYLGSQIQDYLNSDKWKSIKISYVSEQSPMGTIGALSMITDFKHDYILVTNSDILTNLNYEDFFLSFIRSEADFSVVNIPYAVLETKNEWVTSLKEKPVYTYYSNGGIYLMKRSVLNDIPASSFFNTTDLMERLIVKGKRVHSYPLHSYWLDIGRMEDYLKAQHDVKNILLE